MTALYLLHTRCEAKKRGGRCIVTSDGGIEADVPLLQISCIVAGRQAQLTTQLLFALMKEKIPVFYVDRRGQVCGRIEEDRLSWLRLDKQIQCFQDPGEQMALARYVITRKIEAQKEILQRGKIAAGGETLRETARLLGQYKKRAAHAETSGALRGEEGAAAQAYFQAFRAMLPENVPWTGRKQYPSVDPVNAMLSYGYAFLERDTRIALAGARLDPRVGFLHSTNGRKDSLVYDVMDLFRQKVVDTLVLRLFRNDALRMEQFQMGERECRLSEAAAAIWAEAYEKRMETARKAYGDKTPRAWMRSETRYIADAVEKYSLETVPQDMDTDGKLTEKRKEDKIAAPPKTK